MSAWSADPPETTDEIGPNQRIAFVVGSDNGFVGLIEWHRDPQGEWCSGFVSFDVPANADLDDRRKWTVEYVEPLTLSPSLLCRTCGNHGFIRDGRWVPA